jgi:hypothetical protein
MTVTWRKVAFIDEVAALSSEVAHDIGTTASAGVAGDASRHDHVHRLGNGAVDTAAVLGADVVDATKIADDAVGSEHIEALSAKLEVNGQQLENAVLENNASDPSTPVLGKVYFKTGDLHPYVCTVIS